MHPVRLMLTALICSLVWCPPRVPKANQAAKKAQRTSVSLSARLQQWILPINAIYFLYRIVWHFASLTSWTLAGYAFLLGSTYLSYSWVVGAAEEGGSSEYATLHIRCMRCSPCLVLVLTLTRRLWQVRDGRAHHHALRAGGAVRVGLLLARVPRGKTLVVATRAAWWRRLIDWGVRAACFLQIPGFLLYHGGRMLLNYVFTPDAADNDEDDPNAAKRKEKAERRANRTKFRSGRR
jgi:hypothetical protein